MTDTNTNQPANQPTPPSMPPTAAPAPDANTGVSAKEVEEGKVLAMLSYVIPFLFLVPLLQRNNTFSLYHSKQCLLIYIIVVAISTVLRVAFVFFFFLFHLLWLAIIVLAIMGLLNAAKGEMKPIPLIGKFAEDWFKGIQKM